MTNGNLRKAELKDIPELVRIRAEVRENILSDPSKVTHADYVRFVTAGEMWVWEESGRLLGFSAGDERDGWIWAVFVDPAHERKGIGKVLLASACGSLIRAGFKQATLTTDVGTRAAEFYRRAGWSDSGRAEDGQIIFKRDLSAPTQP